VKLTSPLFSETARGSDPTLGIFRATRYGPVLASHHYGYPNTLWRRPKQNATFTQAQHLATASATLPRTEQAQLAAIYIAAAANAERTATPASLLTIDTPRTIPLSTIT